MKKNVYSVILSESVVAAIDRLAYANGTNRSGMINRILAEYVSYETPEMKIHDTISRLERAISENQVFRLMADTSDNTMSVKSSLVYKYNPSVRYSVELFRVPTGDGIGELRVSLRTQNATLIEYFSEFCGLFSAIEAKFGITARSEAGSCKFSRMLCPRANSLSESKKITESKETVGELIAVYLNLFDSALKTFFEYTDNKSACVSKITGLYSDYIKAEPAII